MPERCDAHLDFKYLESDTGEVRTKEVLRCERDAGHDGFHSSLGGATAWGDDDGE